MKEGCADSLKPSKPCKGYELSGDGSNDVSNPCTGCVNLVFRFGFQQQRGRSSSNSSSNRNSSSVAVAVSSGSSSSSLPIYVAVLETFWCFCRRERPVYICVLQVPLICYSCWPKPSMATFFCSEVHENAFLIHSCHI